MNREILIDMLGDEYQILEAADGEQALQIIQKESMDIDLVLLDIVMPKMDGFEVLTAMNRQGWINDIPVMIISSETQHDIMERAYELGAVDFISRPFDQFIVHKRTTNTILLYAKQRKLAGMVAEQIYEKEKQSGLMIDILSHIVEFRNGESGLHVRHVRVLTDLFLHSLQRETKQYPLTEEQMSIITTASALHDIGKIAIPDEIINKPGRLTEAEFDVMKTHSSIGAEMLGSLPIHQQEPLLRSAYQIARWHHERWDGRGYPDGLKGDDIPISAQIVALADVYDALTSERVYKPAYSHKQAVEMILDGQCGAFNPMLMKCLRDVADDLPRMLREAADNGDARGLKILAEEMQRSEALTSANHTLQLLERERMKARFFADMSREVQFEYTASPSMLMLSSFGALSLGLSESIMNPQQDERVVKIIGEENLRKFSDALHATSPEEPVINFECKLSIDGEKRWNRISCRVLWSDETPPRYLGVIGKAVDIHDEHSRMNNLEWQSSHDKLTGLFNHATARQHIESRIALRPYSKFAMLMFDMVGFKEVNDTQGRRFGDKMLAFEANRLHMSVRSGDIVARVGGDEFMIFLEYKETDTPAIQRIFRCLNCEYENLPIRISMGVARTSEVGTDYEALFRAAGQALYSAKSLGGHQISYYHEGMKDMLSAVSVIEGSKPQTSEKEQQE